MTKAGIGLKSVALEADTTATRPQRWSSFYVGIEFVSGFIPCLFSLGFVRLAL